MKPLTLDIGVLMRGSGLAGESVDADACRELMELMKDHEQSRLVLDDKGYIQAHYVRKMGSGAFGSQWVLDLAKNNKIEPCKLVDVDRGTRTRLQECHFDPEDFRYARLAASSPNGLLVAYDDDYSNDVRKVMKRRMGVKIIDAQQGLGFLDDH